MLQFRCIYLLHDYIRKIVYIRPNYIRQYSIIFKTNNLKTGNRRDIL